MSVGRFGLHMGNSTICLSVNKENKVEVVATKFGERCAPAYVAATTTDDEFLIGSPAKERYTRDFLFTVTNNYQFLRADDMSCDELAAAKADSVCAFDETTAGETLEYVFRNAKAEYETKATPHEVAVKLFENVYENATQAFISDKRFEAVLAVPVHYSAAARRNVIAAATEAGFNVLQIITEPTAALLAYEIGFNADATMNGGGGGATTTTTNTSTSTVLVYRLGGLTTDITLFRIVNGLYEQLDYVHLNYGGNLITKTLADYMMPSAVRQLRLTGTKERDTRIKIYAHAENCKRILSTMQSTQVYMENLVTVDDRCIESNATVTRARFENAFASKMLAFVQPIDDLLAKHPNVNVDKVILCGGNMKIPKIQATIGAQFPNAQVLNTIQPDEVIAMGCARQASFICEAATGAIVANHHHLDIDQVDMDVPALTSDIYVRATTVGTDVAAAKSLLFASGTTLPAERQLDAGAFVCDGGDQLSADVIQAERVDCVKAAAAVLDGMQLIARIDYEGGDKEPASIQLQFKATEQLIS